MPGHLTTPVAGLQELDRDVHRLVGEKVTVEELDHLALGDLVPDLGALDLHLVHGDPRTGDT